MRFNKQKINNRSGFSLVESVFAAAIFAFVALSIYQGFVSINRLISASRDKIAAIDLINQEFELIRNLSYSKVGLVGGIPSGVLMATTTVILDGRQFEVTRVIRNIDDPFDGTIGGSPNDLSPADHKMVQINVFCPNCKNESDYEAHTFVAPKNLESASANGAIFVRVFDANGNPVPQANVSIINSLLGININETTDNNGLLQVVDVPPAENSYRIIASKSGFTTDRTYATSTGNPNPVKTDVTVLVQQLTQVSFVIDKVSVINVFSRDLECNPIPNIPFGIAGSKLIGTSPNVLKFSGNYSTDSSGVKTLNNIEWDSFNLTPDGGSLELVGVNPPSPFAVLPDSVQNVDIIFEQSVPNSLLVTVKDSVTGLPLSGVNLTLTQGSFEAQRVTGRGYAEQTDWSSGSGQQDFTDTAMYWVDDGNMETLSPAGDLKLKKVLGDYALSGFLTSSIFDTGTTSNFSNIVWSPTDQPQQSGPDSVRFQIATSASNTSTTTWQYLGPDGTSLSYYTTSNNNISSVHNGDRYFRYKVFLNTLEENKTPNLAFIAFTYTSGCVPPGQAIFEGLSSGNHHLLLEKAGYQTQEFDFNIITNDDWQSIEAIMSPE